jgi:sterol desaturase/sphingolipid hydroxylase (fatty acid hydroxylase superfamily)
LILVILAFDLWMYLWHRANHRIPFLWRFHRMHHSDPEMDASTGLRFHPGEQLLSGMARLLVIPVLGVSITQLAVYEALLLPVILFHHSNVAIPDWMDRGLRALVVTPAMHRVHHSRWQPETDSNYGSVFPWWDRLLGSFRLREDARTIHLGLDEFDGPGWQSLGGMLRTPLAPLETREAGAKPQGSPPGSPMGD